MPEKRRNCISWWCNIMELTKEDNQMVKGVAILGMLMLHLFCRTGELRYEPYIHYRMPLVYFFGLFGDLCVPTYCFAAGMHR